MRHGVSVLEVVMLIAIAAFMILPVMQLSSANVGDSQEILERTVAQGMCLDLMERLKNYPIDFPVPGEPAPRPGMPPLPTDLLFPVVREQHTSKSAFQQVFEEQLHALKYAKFQPIYNRLAVPDPFRKGLFLLEVSVSWTSLKGAHREVKLSRYCYAHRQLGGKPPPPPAP